MAAPQTYSANNLITDALQKLGLYAPGESITDADMSRALVVLNDMLDQWQNEGVFVYSLTTETLNLSNGAASYTIGPPSTRANITSGRPNKIQMGPGAASVVNGATTYPVNVVSRLEWNAVQGISPGGGIPDTLFYDPQYPAGVLNVAPTPNVNGLVLSFYALFPLYSFAAYTTSAAFSQGTVDALKANLAVRAKPYFSGAQIETDVAAMATVGKEFLRTTGVVSRAMLKRSPNPIGKPAGPQSITTNGGVVA